MTYLEEDLQRDHTFMAEHRLDWPNRPCSPDKLRPSNSLVNRSTWIGAFLLAVMLAGPGVLSGAQEGKGREKDAEAAKSDQQRAEAIRKVCRATGIGPGSAVADIGCGKGADTVTFAQVVGPKGKVYAEEIDPGALTNTTQKVRELNLDQVVPILGESADPRLPPGALDLEYMHFVFHHFAHPREMLHQLWLGLKPGGWLVIIDREKGPLKLWVADETREKKHNWTGETTVVRLARESGFLFAQALENEWYEREPFVLAFRKPANSSAPALDPDPALPFEADSMIKALALSRRKLAKLAFVGLDEGRTLLPALQKKLGRAAAIYDVVLEEWATSTNEVPPTPAGLKAEVLRTARGKLLPAADPLTFSGVIFADAYHRLWDPAKLLGQLREKLPKHGWVVVLDRTGPPGEERRIAGHHRRIAPGLVREEFTRAGFEFVSELKPPAPDRFLLRFRVRSG